MRSESKLPEAGAFSPAHVPTALRAHVASIFHYQAGEVEPLAMRILPAAALELVVPIDGKRLSWQSLSGQASASGTPVVSGPRRRAFDIFCAPSHRVLCVGFHPGGAWPLLGTPMDHLVDTHVTLEDLLGAAARQLGNRIADQRDDAGRVSTVVGFLLDRARRGIFRTHPAVSALTSAPDTATVGAVVKAAGLSHRRFIELFRREVGLIPRDFLRVRRLARALARVHEFSAADLAYEGGYADQSHFILECRKLTGLTPRELSTQSVRGQMLPIRPPLQAAMLEAC